MVVATQRVMTPHARRAHPVCRVRAGPKGSRVAERGTSSINGVRRFGGFARDSEALAARMQIGHASHSRHRTLAQQGSSSEVAKDRGDRAAESTSAVPETPEDMAAKVLVVDDDAAVSYIVAETLRDEDFSVSVAGNGLEALQLLEDGLDPDALVVDLAMPVMDGRELVREMRERGWDVPVLVLSAVGARQAMKELGAEASLEKPFDLDRLVARVRTLTEHD